MHKLTLRILELADWNMSESSNSRRPKKKPFADAFILRMDAWGCGRQHCWKKYMRYSYRLLHRYYECWSSGDVAHLKPFWLQQIAASFIGLKVLFRDVRDIPRYICSGIIMGCGATTGVISTGESAGQVPDQMDARFQLIGWVHICFVSSPALLYLLFGIMITHDSLKKNC